MLNTTINKNGYELSGGQKQILSIARALYKDSNIIIFDEANSALDDITKKNLKDILLMLKGKKTIIFVTHDVDYFKDSFDLIYRINEK
jgi:HlyD family secretion protein